MTPPRPPKPVPSNPNGFRGQGEFAGRVEPDRALRTVTIGQACDLAGVSRRTIYNWLGKGKLRWWRTVGGGVRIVEASLWEGER